jgi:hypothetical protein
MVPILKFVVVCSLFLAVRHLVHGDAAYFSTDVIVKVANLLIPLLGSVTGHTPTTIYVLEAVAILPCLCFGFMFARKLIGANGRIALMQYTLLLFVIAPAVFVASTQFRNSWCGGDPHKRPVPSNTSTGIPSIEDPSLDGFISPHVSHGSSGELVLCNEEEEVCVEDVSEEDGQSTESGNSPPPTVLPEPKKPVPEEDGQSTKEDGQSTKSGDSPPASSLPKPKKHSRITIRAPDLKHDQCARVYSVMKDLGKYQFLVFCVLGITLSSVCSYILVHFIGA